VKRALLALLVVAGCAPSLPDSFHCTVSSQCVSHGMAGVCQPNGACSFVDGSCASGQRYGEFGPSGIAGSCVGAGPGDGGSGPGGPDGGGNPGPITLVATAMAVGGGTLTFSVSSDVAAGDFAMASFLIGDAAGTVTPPSGWSLHLDLSATAGASYHAFWFSRVVDTAGPSSYAFTVGGAGAASGGLVVYRGVSTSAPFDAATHQQFTGGSFVAPSITTTHAGAMLLAMFVDGKTSGLGFGTPAGLGVAIIAGDVGMFDGLQATPGASGPKDASPVIAGVPVPGIGAVDYVALAPP
jgi:hypothetical protein